LMKHKNKKKTQENTRKRKKTQTFEMN